MRPDQIIISIGGNDIEDYLRTVDLFLETCTADDIAAIEINGACPNVKHGGGVMSASADAMCELIKAVKKTYGDSGDRKDEYKFPKFL